MLKKILVIVLILACLLQPTSAYAWRGCGWRRCGWGWGWGAVGLVETAAVLNAAYQYPYYYANGVPYYYGNPYYPAAPVGYVGVAQPPVAYVPASAPAAAPSVTQAPAVASVSDSVDIHIPNGNGSFTLVTLQKTEKGFLGPQGEFYADHPTEDQLRARYIKK